MNCSLQAPQSVILELRWTVGLWEKSWTLRKSNAAAGEDDNI